MQVNRSLLMVGEHHSTSGCFDEGAMSEGAEEEVVEDDFEVQEVALG